MVVDAAALVASCWAGRTCDSYPLVEVLFHDARAFGVDNWVELTDAIAATPIRSVAVGYLVSRTDDHLNLVGLVNEAHVGHGISIPAPWVARVRVIV